MPWAGQQLQSKGETLLSVHLTCQEADTRSKKEHYPVACRKETTDTNEATETSHADKGARKKIYKTN